MRGRPISVPSRFFSSAGDLLGDRHASQRDMKIERPGSTVGSSTAPIRRSIPFHVGITAGGQKGYCWVVEESA